MGKRGRQMQVRVLSMIIVVIVVGSLVFSLFCSVFN